MSRAEERFLRLESPFVVSVERDSPHGFAKAEFRVEPIKTWAACGLVLDMGHAPAVLCVSGEERDNDPGAITCWLEALEEGLQAAHEASCRTHSSAVGGLHIVPLRLIIHPIDSTSMGFRALGRQLFEEEILPRLK